MTEAEAAEAADGPDARRRWRGEGVGFRWAWRLAPSARAPTALAAFSDDITHALLLTKFRIADCHVAVGRREQIRYMLFGKALINLRHLFVPTRHTFRVALSAFS